MPGAKTTISVYEDDIKTVTFAGVKADDITDNLTIRIASINGVNAETVARNGVLQISTVQSSYFSMLSLAERKKQEAAAAEERKRREAAAAEERKREEAEERKLRWEEYREDYLVFPVCLELGYVYQPDYPLGFRFGLFGFYMTWNFHLTDWGEYGTDDSLNFDKDGKIIGTTNYSFTYLDKQTKASFEWIVGFSINVINNRLRVPIGMGLRHSLDYRLFRGEKIDYNYGGDSSEGPFWIPAGVLTKGSWGEDWQNDLLFEIGLSFNPIEWISLFASWRSIGWQENSFTLGAGFTIPNPYGKPNPYWYDY
jgi:ribosomal protein L12E/L44/L45/RPP1/RPP2